MKRLLLLDNYDSFTYNLFQILEQHSKWRIDVRKNDQISLEEVHQFDKIMLSPGPGIPKDAGIMMDLIAQFKKDKSIFGVCLGHHAIAEVFGARLYQFPEPVHGKQRRVYQKAKHYLFSSIPKEFIVGLYHSWAVSSENFPSVLEETARSEKEVIMALRHCEYDISGVQFHPESIMTPMGKQMLWNWLDA